MSLVDTGAGRAASGAGEGRAQLESSRSNIEHRGERGKRERERARDGASLLLERKLNRAAVTAAVNSRARAATASQMGLQDK
jgi:hypothetical protein